MSDTLPYIFWPQDVGPYETDLHRLLADLSHCTGTVEASDVVLQHLQILPCYPNADIPRLRYRAYLLVMLDLLRQGWTHTCSRGRIHLTPPIWTQRVTNPESIRQQKHAIRVSLSYQRLAQLNKPAVQRFIHTMERPRPFGGQMVSIKSLFANGAQLASDLAAVVTLPDTEAQKQVIETAIQPYLQLVTPNSRCKYTGLLLNDIWRYMRYTWSIPYNSTPGHNMFYLVRDAARPFHPVIGIAALGNSMMQITARDHAIGWTPQMMFERIRSETFTSEDAETIAGMLITTLQTAIDDLATEDLVSEDDLMHPSEATFVHLKQAVDEARAERIELLQELQQLGRQRVMPPNQMMFDLGEQLAEQEQVEQLEQQAQAALFRTKRANTLRALLIARRTIDSSPLNLASVEGMQAKLVRVA